jgi:hypothetical protein
VTTRADLKLTNLLNQTTVNVNALVDTGVTSMCITEELALRLGFDTSDVRRQLVTFADGTQHWKPKVAPVEIAFGNRAYVTEAVVIGNEAQMGALPIQAMDLLVDPVNRLLIPNPKHPNFPVASAK